MNMNNSKNKYKIIELQYIQENVMILIISQNKLQLYQSSKSFLPLSLSLTPSFYPHPKPLEEPEAGE